MNALAILSLISDLYTQIQRLQEKVAELEEKASE